MPIATQFDTGIIKPDLNELNWAVDWNSNLDKIDRYFAQEGDADPNDDPVIEGVYLGQRYLQTNSGEALGETLWVCTAQGTSGVGGTAVWTKMYDWIAQQMGAGQSTQWQKGQSGIWIDAGPDIVANQLVLNPRLSNFFFVDLTGDLEILEPVADPAFGALEAVSWILETKQGAGLYNLTFTGASFVFQNDVAPDFTQIDAYKDTFQFVRNKDGDIEVTTILGFAPGI